VPDEPTHEEADHNGAAAMPEAQTDAEAAADIEAAGPADAEEGEAAAEAGSEAGVPLADAEEAEETEEAKPEEAAAEEAEEAEPEEAEEGAKEPEPEEAAAEAVEEAEAKEAEPEEAEEAEEGEGAEADEATTDAQIRVVDDGIKRRWYAIHAHSGQESNVKKSVQVLAEQAGLGDLIANVLVPMENVAEIKSGQKRITRRKFFPGYVLVQLPEHPERNPELWHLIKNTPGVTGFIGSRSVPVPLEDAEVGAILEEIRGERERPKPKVKFESGERVKIVDGPFSNFLGNIDEINFERGKIKVMVEIFERLTSVEVEFWQVEKI